MSLAGAYTRLWRYRVVGSELVEFTERVERRVRGGYMNRWWIRQVTYEPNRSRIIIDDVNRIIYCHPQLVDKIRLNLERSGP